MPNFFANTAPVPAGLGVSGQILDPRIRAMYAKIARLNGSDDPSRAFAIIPTYHSSFEMLIQRKSDFLSRINNGTSLEITTGKMYGEIAGQVTKRTKVDRATGHLRQPLAAPTDTDASFTLREHEYDFEITWQRIAEMARFKNYQTLYRNELAAKIARDRTFIALQGVAYVDDTTDLTQMDKGVLQQLRDANPGNFMSEGAENHGKIVVGALRNIAEKGTWANGTDYAFRDAVNTAEANFICIAGHTANADEPTLADPGDNWEIRPHYTNMDDLVLDLEANIPDHKLEGCINMTSRAVIAEERAKLYQNEEYANKPSEKLKIEQAARSFGARTTDVVNFMPSGTLIVSTYKNFTHKYQIGSYIRAIDESSQTTKSQIDWNRIICGFILEDEEAITGAENIEFLNLDRIEALYGT